MVTRLRASGMPTPARPTSPSALRGAWSTAGCSSKLPPMSELQEIVAVCLPLVVCIVGGLSVRAWRRDRRVLQLVGGLLGIAYGPITILNLSLLGNACGDFLFADIGYAPRSAFVDVIGKGCFFFAAISWGLDAIGNRASTPDGDGVRVSSAR